MSPSHNHLILNCVKNKFLSLSFYSYLSKVKDLYKKNKVLQDERDRLKQELAAITERYYFGNSISINIIIITSCYRRSFSQFSNLAKQPNFLGISFATGTDISNQLIWPSDERPPRLCDHFCLSNARPSG